MIFTIIVFLIVLSILVLAHELGHFWAAKKFGVAVEEFGIGFPPRAKTLFKKGETTYSLNWIPLGGFVKLKGEDGADTKSENSFAAKKVWQRAIIISAGVIMNIVLTIVLLALGFMIGIPQAVSDDMPEYASVRQKQLQIVEVVENSPAQAAEIERGDILLSAEGSDFTSLESFQEFIASRQGETLSIQIKRGGDIMEKEITPEILEETDQPAIGVGIVESGIVSYPWYRAIINGFVATFNLFIAIILAFYAMIKSLLFGSGLGMDVLGPVGIADYTGRFARMGFNYIVQFTALLSINLAILNFLPFPALDGGRFIFLVAEKLRGKPVNQKVEAAIHNLGFAILMILVILVTYRDIVRFFQ